MSLKEDLEKFYSEVKGKGRGYRPRRFISENLNFDNVEVLMKTREDGKCEIIFRIHGLKGEVRLPNASSSMEISQRSSSEEGKSYPDYIEINFCCIEKHETVFSFFALSLIENMRCSNPRDTLDSLLETFYKWRELFKTNNNKLTLDQVRGLWAELFILNYLLEMTQSKTHPKVVLSSWKGPQMSRWDFIIENKLAIESKSCKDDGVVRISSEVQLNNQHNGISDLLLAVISIQDNHEGKSLNDLYKEIKEKLHEDSLIMDFHTLLSFVHVTPKLLEDEYADKYFTILGQSFFRVSEGFPRIVNTPQEIRAVRYQLQTDNDVCRKYKISPKDLEKTVLASFSLS